MAGHSKWHNIQHRKGAQDAKRGKLFTKLIREIVVAAKMGDPDPANNPRLRTAIDKALSLPIAACLSSAKLIIACKYSNHYEDIFEVVSLFQWLLPGLATNVSYLRAQLNGLNLKRK